jgi:hypothetical protein
LRLSERRICRVLGQHRSTQRRVPRGPDDEERLTADIVELARRHGRLGYRKIAEMLRSTDAIDVLSDQFILRGVPEHIRSDNRPDWIGAVGAKMAYIERGSPWENGFIETDVYWADSNGRRNRTLGSMPAIGQGLRPGSPSRGIFVVAR